MSAPAASPSSPAVRLFSTRHTTIGIEYLSLAFVAVTIGVVLSILIRFRVFWPGPSHPLLSPGGVSPVQFDAVVAMHGTIMLFFVLAIAVQSGLGTYLLPLQVGAREMAAPRINALAFWGTCISLAGVLGSFLLPGEIASQTAWVASICLFCVCAMACALNFVATTIDLRAPGTALLQMPLTAWAWFIAAILILMTCSVELAAGVLLTLDRVAGTSFFYSPDAIVAGGFRDLFGNSTLTWSHLFWFFGDPLVYIVLLPALGIVSHVLSVFCRKPLFGSRLAVLMICALGFLGFAIWGRHMFISGMNPYATFSFSVLAISIGIPAMVMTLLWLATLWRRPIERTPAMLFTLGFVALFVTGGVSGLFLALPALQIVVQGPEYVSGHFHLILAMAAVFAIFAGIYFWFPKMFGRTLNERWGKIHFWLTFVGAYAIFLPLHFLGSSLNATGPGTHAVFGALSSAAWLEAVPGVASIVTGAAQLIFVFNFWASLAKGQKAPADPWHAGTLEWAADDGSASHRSGHGLVTLTTVSLGSVLVFFMALASAYLIRRGNPIGQAMAFAPPRAEWAGVAFLIAATVATARGCSLLRLGAAPEAQWAPAWLKIGSGTAFLFLALQGLVWRHLLSTDAPLAADPSRDYFFLFSAAQGLLLLGGIAANWAATRSKAGDMRSAMAEPLSIYWNFATGLWVFLLALLSLRA
ncbi:MAG TPA: cbb3-type cytochrome c oxidase subunit I [Verrucomicrobiae bacterium]|nr:cbb3-type cytochrome c oxidase subunit I [Verrucomicrobiae bacterium]